MKYNFTDRVRKVLAMSREEAIRLNHSYVGTEHMLLALLRDRGGVGAAVLVHLGVDFDGLRDQTTAAVRAGKEAVTMGELPYTSRAKKVLEYAMAEVRELRHSHVATEHLLLGLLREERGIAAEQLHKVGVTLELARKSALELIAEGGGPDVPPEIVAPVRKDPGADEVWFLELDESSSTPIYEQIVARIEEAVATGRLERGERLPSVRDLSAELGIAPGTVARAYTELERRGVVKTEGAKGTHVSNAPRHRRTRVNEKEGVERLLRRVVVAAFHRGLSAQELRAALERTMNGILRML